MVGHAGEEVEFVAECSVVHGDQPSLFQEVIACDVGIRDWHGPSWYWKTLSTVNTMVEPEISPRVGWE